MAQQITYDKAYDAVAPEDFPAMLEVPRYGRRSNAFDGIISATHDHFWDPLDKRYIDFADDFDPDTTDFIPDHLVPAMQTDYVNNVQGTITQTDNPLGLAIAGVCFILPASIATLALPLPARRTSRKVPAEA